MTSSDQISIVSAGIAFGSAVVSVLAIYIPWRNTHDTEIFKEAVLALERSYSALMQGRRDGERPNPDRLAWLTSARQIESYKALRDSLKTGLYARLCREHEEYWRNEYYLCLVKEKIYQKSYFECGPIEPGSAIIIFGFAAWPKRKEDPIDKLEIQALYRESNLLAGNAGLRDYLSSFPQYNRN
jgi:hypothetical protein